ncbi:hypothetical protein, partial [Faecalibacterium sp. An192]|uniref:hypothetical protein n=1 Tax=Faecalibacterium sp. An192 TaxID=1965581 RepID=UPI0019D25EF1
LDMCVFLSGHTNTPCIGLFSYTGGVLSIVRFYWFGSNSAGLFCQAGMQSKRKMGGVTRHFSL